MCCVILFNIGRRNRPPTREQGGPIDNISASDKPSTDPRRLIAKKADAVKTATARPRIAYAVDRSSRLRREEDLRAASLNRLGLSLEYGKFRECRPSKRIARF